MSMNVYEHIVLTKKRINSKKWEEASHTFNGAPDVFDRGDPKVKHIVYVWTNAESVGQVEELVKSIRLLITSPLGSSPIFLRLDTEQILRDSLTAPRSSDGNKPIVIANLI
jgi:hypothetical protein